MHSYPDPGRYTGIDGNDSDYYLDVLTVDQGNDKIVILDYPFSDRLVIGIDEWQVYWEDYMLEQAQA